jgi:uncharacterized membrane protein YciS (DUF1049 family)
MDDKQMVGILLLTGTFMSVILVAIIMLIIHMKHAMLEREVQFQRQQNEMKKRVDDIQDLFKNEIRGVIASIKNILKNQ